MSATVVLVGAGPGSVSLLERLIANHRDGRIDVHLVDPHPAGSGRVWRAAQSRLMRMNSMAEDVTMFTDDSVVMVGPVRPGPTLAEWVTSVRADELDDPTLLPVIRAVTPSSFPDRRVQGEYLGWFLARAIDDAPPGFRVHIHAATVLDVRDGKRQSVVLDNGMVVVADVVVLSLGHVDAEPGGESAELGRQAAAAGLVYVPPAYTADVGWDAVPAGADVVVRGLGLAFVDLAILLTESRGGRFMPRAGGRFDYLPSGREPRLWAGSRRGLIHHSKTAYSLQGPRPPLPAVFTPAVVDELIARGPVDFRADVWPYVAAEIRWAYYHELFHAHPGRVTAGWRDVEPLLCAPDCSGVEKANAVLAAVVPDPADRIDLAMLDAPMAGRRFESLAELDAYVVTAVEADVARRSDPVYSADLGAFLGVLCSFGQIQRLVQCAAIDPASQLLDVDGWWRGLFNHLASGPPPERLEQLMALARAGVLNFLGAGLTVHVEHGAFVARSASVSGVELRATALIEARLPKPHLDRGPGRLIEALRARGEVTGEVLVDRDGLEHPTGLLRVDSAGRILGADARPYPTRYAIGPLTTSRAAAAFSRPNVNAATFRTSDAMARAILATLAARAGQGARAGSVAVRAS